MGNLLEAASALLGETLEASGQEIGLAGRNVVLAARSPSGEDRIIRAGKPGREAEFRSGLEIRRRGREAGLPMAEDLASDAEGKVAGFPLLVMRRMPGQDLERACFGLSRVQALGVALEVARIQKESFRLFGKDDRGGFGRHLLGAPAEDRDWEGHVNGWLAWTGERAVGAERLSRKDLDTAKAELQGMGDLIRGAPRRAFLFDIGERNVMVESGELSGLVDQDELMSGDPMMAPALAREALALLGWDRAEEYARVWLDELGAGSEDRRRFGAYAGIWAIHLGGKAGGPLPDGRMDMDPGSEQIRERLGMSGLLSGRIRSMD